MNKPSNKGQTLVMFVIFIPVIIIFCFLVIEILLAKTEKNNLQDISKMAISYGLKNIDNTSYDDIKNMIYENDMKIENCDIKIDVPNKTVSVKVSKSINVIFEKILKKDLFKINVSYKGYIKDDKIIIERDDE